MQGQPLPCSRLQAGGEGWAGRFWQRQIGQGMDARNCGTSRCHCGLQQPPQGPTPACSRQASP